MENNYDSSRFNRYVEMKALEAYIRQCTTEAVKKSIETYGPKEGLIMAPTMIPISLVLADCRLEALKRERLKNAEEYTKNQFEQYRAAVRKAFGSSQEKES